MAAEEETGERQQTAAQTIGENRPNEAEITHLKPAKRTDSSQAAADQTDFDATEWRGGSERACVAAWSK